MKTTQPLDVLFLHRKPRKNGTFSIEFIFQDIRSRLPESIFSRVLVSKYESNGIFKRLYNTLEAAFCKADVKHITGDVHYLALFLRGKKTILTIHDCFFLYKVSGFARWFHKKFWYDIPLKKCRYIVAITEATKREILKLADCDPNKIVVIPSLISSQFQPNPKPFNKQKPVILHVGLAPNKNIERLAEALEGIPCHLSVLGKLEDWHIEMLEKHGIEYSCSYNISDNDVLAMYEACDMLAFASTYEGFGMPIVEANAVGRAVLTSNISSMPFVAGDAACLVDPFDVHSIQQGLLKIINDDKYREQLIENGYVNRQRFDPDAIAVQYARLYFEVANRQPSDLKIHNVGRVQNPAGVELQAIK